MREGRLYKQRYAQANACKPHQRAQCRPVGQVANRVQHACHDECDGEQVDAVDHAAAQDSHQHGHRKERKRFKVVLLRCTGAACHAGLLREPRARVAVVIARAAGLGNANAHDRQYDEAWDRAAGEDQEKAAVRFVPRQMFIGSGT